MSNPPDSTLHLVGLTGTGKTNFLVALDVTLDNQDDHNGLVHSGLAKDRTYLQPLKEKWLRGEVFDRTSRQQPPPPHQLLVKHPSTGMTAGFNMPDLAGESFDSHFATRSIPLELWDRLQQASGLLLFTHCEHNADHVIFEHPSFIDPAPATKTELPNPVSEPAVEWQLENASMQVKLVDLLQFLAEGSPRHLPLRVAVMISAWDLVESAHKLAPGAAAEMPNDPDKFLAARWPLLNQFLQSHAQIFCFRVYGVSARGGDNTPEEIERLVKHDRPSDRIILVDGVNRSADLTRPVRWLLGLTDPISPNV